MSWQRLLDWLKYLLKHKEQTENNTADIKQLRSELDQVADLTESVKLDLARFKDNQTHEREKLVLRLENLLLKEKLLLPSGHSIELNSDELTKRIETLERENEKLRKQIGSNDKE